MCVIQLKLSYSLLFIFFSFCNTHHNKFSLEIIAFQFHHIDLVFRKQLLDNIHDVNTNWLGNARFKIHENRTLKEYVGVLWISHPVYESVCTLLPSRTSSIFQCLVQSRRCLLVIMSCSEFEEEIIHCIRICYLLSQKLNMT